MEYFEMIYREISHEWLDFSQHKHGPLGVFVWIYVCVYLKKIQVQSGICKAHHEKALHKY